MTQPSGWAFCNTGLVYPVTPQFVWPVSNWTITFGAALLQSLNSIDSTLGVNVLEHVVGLPNEVVTEQNEAANCPNANMLPLFSPALVRVSFDEHGRLSVFYENAFDIEFATVSAQLERQIFVIVAESYASSTFTVWNMSAYTNTGVESLVVVVNTTASSAALNAGTPGSTALARNVRSGIGFAFDNVRLFGASPRHPGVLTTLLSSPAAQWGSPPSQDIVSSVDGYVTAVVDFQRALVFEYLMLDFDESINGTLLDSSSNSMHARIYVMSVTADVGSTYTLVGPSSLVPTVLNSDPLDKLLSLNHTTAANANSPIDAIFVFRPTMPLFNSVTVTGTTRPLFSSAVMLPATFSSTFPISGTAFAGALGANFSYAVAAPVSRVGEYININITVFVTVLAAPTCGQLHLATPSWDPALSASFNDSSGQAISLVGDSSPALLVNSNLFVVYTPMLTEWNADAGNASSSGGSSCVSSGVDRVELALVPYTPDGSMSGASSGPPFVLPPRIRLNFQRASPPLMMPLFANVPYDGDLLVFSVAGTTTWDQSIARQVPVLVQPDGVPVQLSIAVLPSDGTLYQYFSSSDNTTTNTTVPLRVGDVVSDPLGTVQWVIGGARHSPTFTVSATNAYGQQTNANVTILMSNLPLQPLPIDGSVPDSTMLYTCPMRSVSGTSTLDASVHASLKYADSTASSSSCIRSCTPMSVIIHIGATHTDILLPWRIFHSEGVNVAIQQFPAHGTLQQVLPLSSVSMSSSETTTTTANTRLLAPTYTTSVEKTMWISSVIAVVNGWLDKGGDHSMAQQIIGPPTNWPEYGDR